MVMLHAEPAHGWVIVNRYGTVPPSGYAASGGCSVLVCHRIPPVAVLFQACIVKPPVEFVTLLLPFWLQPVVLVTGTFTVKALPFVGAVCVILGVPWPAVMLPALSDQV